MKIKKLVMDRRKRVYQALLLAFFLAMTQVQRKMDLLSPKPRRGLKR